MNKISGLIAAPFNPMHRGGELAYDRIAEYYGFLKKNKIVGAFINGSTGEGVSLTQKERMKVAEEWTKAADNDSGIKVINLIGGTSYKECIENAIHAKEIGVDAIAVLAPYYFKPADVNQLVEFCAQVAEAVPDLPFYFYHIPVLTACNLSMYDFLVKADPVIPNLAGIKYTHEDFMDFLSCTNYSNGKYDLLWGRDENLLSALVLGARGTVGSTYNYASPLYYKLIEAFDAGNLELARNLQQKSIDMIRLLGKYGGIATGKAYMKHIGFDCGEFRSPVKNMEEGLYAKFNDDVKKLQFEDLLSIL